MYCHDEYYAELVSTLKFGLFSEAVPTLVYYSHITAIFLALFLSIFVYIKKPYALESKILLGLGISVSSITLIDLALWIRPNVDEIMFYWSFWLTLFTIVIFLSFYFLYTFITKRDIRNWVKLLFLVIIVIVETISSTSLNLLGYDYTNCEGIENLSLINIVFFIGFIILLLCIILAVYYLTVHKRNIGRVPTPELLVSTGIIFFLASFLASSYVASYENSIIISDLYVFQIEQYGYFGMTFFFTLLAYAVVKYNTFNIKIFGAQALVATLWILIGSLLFVVQSTMVFYVVCFTLALSVVFGLSLIRSVKYEVEARRLLMEANAGQERFIHFLGHEIKGFFTVARNGYASISEGDYGPVPEPLTQMAKNALKSMNIGVTTVDGILKSANLKSGNVTFTFASFDLCEAIRKRVELAQPLLLEHGLSVNVHVPETPCIIEADEEHITKHVLRNLIENAIYYTQSGSIDISLTGGTNSILFKVKDTGVGITDEDKKKLFTEGGHGKDSSKFNVHSTGHGLFIAKNIVVMHKGRIWAESEGAGKGTTFSIELPVKQSKN